MAANQEETSHKMPGSMTQQDQTVRGDVKIDRTAPAGSEHSLGAQSVRDGRPATDDSVVEAMDGKKAPALLPLTRRRRGGSPELIPKAWTPSTTASRRRWKCFWLH